MNERGRVGQIAVMKDEMWIRIMGVLINMVDPGRIEKGAAALNAMNLVTFGKKTGLGRRRPDP